MNIKTQNVLFLLTLLILAFGNSIHAQNLKPTKNTYTDTRDGKVYETIEIGSQVWLAENFSWLYRWMKNGKERYVWIKQEPDLLEIEKIYNEISKNKLL